MTNEQLTLSVTVLQRNRLLQTHSFPTNFIGIVVRY